MFTWFTRQQPITPCSTPAHTRNSEMLVSPPRAVMSLTYADAADTTFRSPNPRPNTINFRTEFTPVVNAE